MANVELWHRNSTDNSTWSAWVLFGTDTASPWEWSFNFPNGTGYYEFYSRANDTAGNYEDAPTNNDTICGYDNVAPTVTATTPSNGGTTTNVWQNVSFDFSEPMNTSITPTISTNMSGTITYSWESNTKLWVNHSLALNVDTSYYVNISGVEDLAGNQLSGNYMNITFTVKSTNNPPTTTGVCPGDQATLEWFKTAITINWTYSDPDGDSQSGVDIDYSTNSGGSWSDLYYSTSYASSSWDWNNPPESSTLKVRVKTYDGDLWSTEWCESNYDFGHDSVPPASSLFPISPYWNTTGTVDITVSGTDATSGVKNATLRYRYRADNDSAWSEWSNFSTVSSQPYVFYFNMPNGDGHYEFYSIAWDNAGNNESAPETADASCGYDSTPPSSSVSPFVKYWFNQTSVNVGALATDATSGVKNVTLWYRYSSNNISWGDWTLFGTDTSPSWEWSFDWPNGTGHYQFYSIAIDNLGWVEAAPSTADANCGFDNVVPDCSISYPDDPIINTLNLINGSCSDTMSGINRVNITIKNTDNETVYVPDEETVLSGSDWSYPWTPPYDGNYTVTATSFDNALNSKTVWIKFMFDKTTPTTSILVSGTLGTNNWYVSNVTVNLTASDKMSGVRSITYSIGGNETTVYAASTTLILQETTTIYYWSADNAGNNETFKSKKIEIDRIKPSAPELISPVNNSWTNATTIIFNWENATDNISYISNYTLSVDNNFDFSSPEYTALLTVSENSTSLDEGVYYWKVTATDNAGNSNVSGIRVIKIDRVKPGNVTLIYPVGVTINDTNQPNLTWTEAEDNLSGVKEYIIEIDEKGEGFLSPYILTSVTNSIALSQQGFSLSDAKYEWRVRAVDNASNYGERSEIKEFTIETKAPTINKFLINNGEEYTNNKSVILTINITNATIIWLSNDGSDWPYNITITEGYSFAGDIKWNLTEGDGKKTVYLRCKNMTAYSYLSVSIILDQTAPSISLLSPDNDTWVNSAYVSFKWKAHDLTSGLNGTCHIQISTDKAFSVIVYENSSVSGSLVNNETSSYSYQFLSDNIYYWRIIMKDNASNYNYSESWIVKLDATPPNPPNLISPGNNSKVNSSVVTFIWSSVTDFSEIANYLIQIDNDFDFSSPLHSVYLDTNSTSFNLTDGAWYWKVKATDNAGNTGNFSITYKVRIDTGRPSNLRIEINAGASETNTEDVYLAIYAENASEMLISNYEDVWDENWINYTTLYEWKLIYLSPGSAPVNRTVWIRFRNKNGESLTINDAILLNKKPPVVVINETCSIINETSITLYWHLSDEGESDTIHHFEVSNRYGTWIDVGLNRSYTFEGLSQGYHVFYVRGWYKDEDTPGGADSLPVLVDALNPLFTSIGIGDGSGYTNSTSVQLHIHAVDNQSEIVYVSGIHKLFISNDNSNWVEYEYNLSPVFLDGVFDWDILWNGMDEDGNKTIYFKLVDYALNIATTTKVIFLDRAKPTNLSITIFEGEYTNSTSVNLILNASDPGSGVWKMSFSENGVDWSGWIDYSTDYIYQLQSTTEGLKTIYFRVKDRSGNWDWNRSSANITLDLTNPDFTSLTQTPLNLTEDSTYFNITVTIIEGNLGIIIPSLIYRVGEGTEVTVQMKLLTWKTFYLNLTEIDFNASQGKNLYYRIRCFDLAGNINTSLEIQVYIEPLPDVPEPGSPSNYNIINSNTTTLNWAKNTTEPGWYSVEYRVVVEYYNESLGTFVEILNETVSAPETIVSNLAHNITYYWQVKAVNGSAESKWSERWQFTVKLPDLSIAKISFEPSDTIPVETTVLINVTINNIGESDAENVSVSFYKKHPHELGSAHIDTITGLRIRKGGNVTVLLPYYQSSPEKFSTWVWVDSDNKIVEIREDNNLLSGIVEFVSSLDVLPTNITFSVNGAEPSYIFENDAVTITAEIINLGGDIKIPFWAEFWFGDFENDTFNGSLVGKAQVEKILTGKTGSVSINWKAGVGDYKIWVFLNTTNLPSEKVDNNWFNKTFTVNFPTLITIYSSVSLLTTEPSGTLSYTIIITNIGQINDTYNLTVEDLSSGWGYSFIYNGNKIENVTLNPGETIEILLRVKGGGEPGTYSFRVVASSQKDPRAVYETELTAKIKEPFPWYLLIIAVIAAAVITVVGLLVKKGVIVVKAKPAVKIESGYNYLIKGTDVRKAYAVFMQLMKKAPGLCITSTHPRKRRDEYKLSCPVYWLTDVTKTDEKTLHPERLDFELFKTVREFAEEKHGVIMLDGLEYLVHVNGFERTMDFIDSIRDAISTHNGTLVVPANPSVFKEEELGMLEKRFDRILG
ncbi:MAG: DUF835 domain-containing protein [Thermoplasmatales archaeon]|nr:DUF835 domain-containing protein [Thermoplasmatales archaeon]